MLCAESSLNNISVREGVQVGFIRKFYPMLIVECTSSKLQYDNGDFTAQSFEKIFLRTNFHQWDVHTNEREHFQYSLAFYRPGGNETNLALISVNRECTYSHLTR